MPCADPSSDVSSRMATIGQGQVPALPVSASRTLPSSGRFDRVATLAARHFRVPAAVVSLFDPAPYGLSATSVAGAQATVHHLAYCARVLLLPETIVPGTVTVVDDTALDPRFAAIAIAHAPPIRFYAHAPILSAQGQVLGILSLLDQTPREMDAADRRFLGDLAAHAADLLDLQRDNQALAQAATRDRLTGLANRSTFENELEAAMESAFAGRPFALLYIDLDGVKRINDTHGHAVGDEALRQIGRRLSSSIRASDFPARIGGDEFAIILTDPASHDIAARVARRLIADMAAPMTCGTVELSMTASVGCALALRHGTTAAELRHAANEALYMAKRSGGNRLVIADEVVSSPGDASFNSIEQNLARAITSDELKLQWQPYFRSDDGLLTGYEVLVRWSCPGLGPVPPATFIPVAEASGLIGALDEWVLRRACADAAAMPDDLTVSVNLSAYWFSRGELVRLVRSVLQDTGLPPHRLILELTERTIITHTESARQSMDFLRSLGVCFALDDFGTSYSSLNYLRKLPFDTIKLDRSFVVGLGTDPQAEAVAGAIIHLGHALNMKVCAEGVETAQQMAYLTQGHCDLLQGYLLGRPAWEPLHVSGVRQFAVS